MNQFKVIPHPLHDVVPQEPRHPESVCREIQERIQWLEKNGYSKEVDEIWAQHYYGVKK